MSLEQERHRCEVRMLLNAARSPRQGRAWVAAYLDHPAVKGRRENLRRDLNEQIKLKNSGGKGEWISK